jgi:hypothetical protein
MTELSPITPPQELVQQWEEQFLERPTINGCFIQSYIAAKAARWGADQELEACCQSLYNRFASPVHQAQFLAQELRDWLRAARRPKPPSLKERSLQLLETYDTSGVMLTADQVDTIKRALEALDD